MDVVVSTDERTELALENVEVLAVKPAAPKEGGGPRVAATLRVDVDAAVYLVAAQAYAREVRLLARVPGDTKTVGTLAVGDGL